MKKMLIVLAVGMIVTSVTGCGCGRRLCPWLYQGAYCGPTAPGFAPLAAVAPPAAPQYAPAAAPGYTYWDPCLCDVVSRPGVGQPGYARPPYAVQPPMAVQPYAIQPSYTSVTEPGCEFVAEPACGEPYMGTVSFGPSWPADCVDCGPGFGGAVGGPSSGVIVDPAPIAE